MHDVLFQRQLQYDMKLTPMHIFVDGVNREVPLEHMVVKDSVFIPTLDAHETRVVVRRVTKEMGMQVKISSTVHEGYLGVMVTRYE